MAPSTGVCTPSLAKTPSPVALLQPLLQALPVVCVATRQRHAARAMRRQASIGATTASAGTWLCCIHCCYRRRCCGRRPCHCCRCCCCPMGCRCLLGCRSCCSIRCCRCRLVRLASRLLACLAAGGRRPGVPAGAHCHVSPTDGALLPHALHLFGCGCKGGRASQGDL